MRDLSHRLIGSHRPVEGMARRNSGLGGKANAVTQSSEPNQALKDKKAHTKLKQSLVQTILNVNRLHINNRRSTADDLTMEDKNN